MCPRQFAFLFPPFPFLGKVSFSPSKYAEINEETEAREHRFQDGTRFKLLTFNFALLTKGGWKVAHTQRAKANEVVSSSF
jgi:hypothetical protein